MPSTWWDKNLAGSSLGCIGKKATFGTCWRRHPSSFTPIWVQSSVDFIAALKESSQRSSLQVCTLKQLCLALPLHLTAGCTTQLVVWTMQMSPAMRRLSGPVRTFMVPMLHALIGGVQAWLSVWSEVQIRIWPSWCHCHSLSLASVKSRLLLPFWHRITWVVPEKGR